MSENPSHPMRGGGTMKLSDSEIPITTSSALAESVSTGIDVERMRDKMKSDPAYDEELFNLLT